MSYGFFTTGACTNDCLICGVAGECQMGFYHIGQTEKEEAALDNLMMAISEEAVSMTGGDPLRNTSFIKSTLKHNNHNHKTMALNPLTFLCMETEKRASDISLDEAIESENTILEKGFGEKASPLLDYLSHFHTLGISTGNLQSPNPKLMKVAKRLMKEYIGPEINKRAARRNGRKVIMQYHSLDGRFKLGDYKMGTRSICAGALRSAAESGVLKEFTCTYGKDLETGRGPGFKQTGHSGMDYRITKGLPMRHKDMGCSDHTGLGTLYFKKEDDSISLFLSPCCAVGMTPYTTIKTGITVDTLAGSEPKSIFQALGEEMRKGMKSALYRILNHRTLDERKGITEIELTDVHSQFMSYLGVAEDYIRQETGDSIDIIGETYTTSTTGSRACEACHTTGLMMQRAGIRPEKWQSYLEERLS